MIRINLLPAGEVAVAIERRRELVAAAAVLGVAVGLLGLVHGWQVLRLHALQAQQRGLAARAKALEHPYQDAVGTLRMRKELEEKLAVIHELEARRVGPVRVLADLSSAAPARLWLTEFAEKGGKLTISGFGLDEQTIADFLRRLSRSRYFHDVELVETARAEKDGAKLKKFALRGWVIYGAGRARRIARENER